MRLPDVNLLLYAVDATSPRNAAAKAWLEARFSGTETVAFAWVTLLGFVRISTRSSVFQRPLTPDQAFGLVREWLARPNVITIDPTPGHAAAMARLLEPLGTAGNLVTDAHLATLAIEHGATLESCDHDFSRFAGLQWRDPLI